MDGFLLIESERFPILPGEEDELTNPGTYGRALSEYLQQHLPARGYTVPMIHPED